MLTCCLRRFAVHAFLLVALATLAVGPAFAFDYARYQETDLDALLAKSPPTSGVDLYPVLPMKLKVTLVAYGQPCKTGMVNKALEMAGRVNPDVNITSCIQVRSAKGQQVRLFIQDQVSNFLPKEVPLSSSLTLFVVHLFTGTEGPGLLVNEFATEKPAKPI